MLVFTTFNYYNFLKLLIKIEKINGRNIEFNIVEYLIKKLK